LNPNPLIWMLYLKFNLLILCRNCLSLTLQLVKKGKKNPHQTNQSQFPDPLMYKEVSLKKMIPLFLHLSKGILRKGCFPISLFLMLGIWEYGVLSSFLFSPPSFIFFSVPLRNSTLYSIGYVLTLFIVSPKISSKRLRKDDIMQIFSLMVSVTETYKINQLFQFLSLKQLHLVSIFTAN